MPLYLENGFLQLCFEPESGRWSLRPRASRAPAFENLRISFDSRPSMAHPGIQRWEPAGGVRMDDSPHGPLQRIDFAAGSTRPDLSIQISFMLPDLLPAVFWQVRLANRGDNPVTIDRLTLFESSDPPQNLSASAAVFFASGWQSWSYTGAYRPGDRQRRTRLGPLRAPTEFHSGRLPHPDPHSLTSEMFGVLGDRASRKAALIGFLAQRQHFGSVSALLQPNKTSLRLWANGDATRLDPRASMETDLACVFFLDIDAPDPLGAYLESFGRECGTPAHIDPAKIPTGWCSWYQFSSDDYLGTVTANDIRSNLEAVSSLRADLPLKVIQIDDGFQSQIGDWMEFNPGFPNGVAPLAQEINAAGFTPGLWLAPFIVHPGARLWREHPDWLITTRSGRPANAGFLWNRFAAGLDISHPEVLDYVSRVISTAVEDWGFRYLKLDFLYAGVIPGRRFNPTRTRAQALVQALQVIREAAGKETFLLGCGCPLGPAVGWADGMRICPDTARRWKPAFNGIEAFISAEPDFPSARNACHNSLTRAPLHRRWWVNDPDCLLVRPKTQLIMAEVQTTATTIALTGGSIILSDDLPGLPADRLRLVQSLLPPIGLRPEVLDWIDSSTPERVRLDLEGPLGSWHLIAAYNWADEPRDLKLRPVDYRLSADRAFWGREFWSGRSIQVGGNRSPRQSSNPAEWVFPDVPAHGVVLLSVRPAASDPVYLGSNLHISQGLEVQGWESSADRLELRFDRPERETGHIDLYLPRSPYKAELSGNPVLWTSLGNDCWRFQLSFEGNPELILCF